MSAPTYYRCNRCEIQGVRLWRQYNTFLSNIELMCRVCTCKDQGKDLSDLVRNRELPSDQIGWMIPAIPDRLPEPVKNWKLPKDYTFWGYTSVPKEGVDWWWGLP